jgi:AraC family ethanolamine operon transcriptional activator
MFSHAFHDFDAFADTVRDADMEMMLCKLQRRVWDIGFVDVGGIHVQVGNLGSGNLVRGTSEMGRHLAYLPLSGDNESTLNGKVLRRNAFAIMPPGCEFSLSELDAHRWMSIAVPSHLVTGCGDVANSDRGSESMDCRVTRAQPGIANRLAALILEIFGAAGANPTFETGPAARSASEELLRLALPVFGQPLAVEPSATGRPRVPRQTIIDCAMALIESADGDPVSVSKMAAAAGVSERTLRNAFNEYFGMGPVRYFELRQIYQVHRGLSEVEPGSATVTDVLARNGVWQWGRFAARYRQVFGEQPSETLRAKTRCLDSPQPPQSPTAKESELQCQSLSID